MKTQIVNLKNEKVAEIDLIEEIFAKPYRKDIIARMVNWQLAARRSGTHKVKGESEVSGTGAKPYKQKGTGRARHGSLRSPQYRGGAVIFGPVVRSHAFDLTKKFRKLALKTALSAKLAENKLIILDEAVASTHKTKDILGSLKTLGLENALFIDGDVLDVNFKRATANLPHIDVLPQMGANVYDIVRCDRLVLTKAAVEALQSRL